MKENNTEIVNAIITGMKIENERDFLSSWIFLDYGGSGQGFGGYALGSFDCSSEKHANQPNVAAEWIVKVLKAAGVSEWSDLKGKTIRVRREAGWNGKIIGIGHVIKEDHWFEPRVAFANLDKKGN